MGQSLRRIKYECRRSLHSFLHYYDGNGPYNEMSSNSGVHPTSGSRLSSPQPAWPLTWSPRVRLPGHEGRLYPILPAGRPFVEPVMMSLKGSRPLFNTKTWIRRRRAADRDTAQKIGCFTDPRIYIFYDNFYLNTIKPYIHPNRLSILFPARLCWVFFDIVEANYGVLSQNPVLVLRRPQVVPNRERL